MSTAKTNGEYDALTSPRGQYQNQAEGSASPPLTDLETAEVLQSIRNSTTDPSTTLPVDLALSLDIHQTSPQQPQQTSSEAQDLASYYWDASTMAPLNAVSAAAIARLRAYKPPPFPIWDRLPVTRRAAVLILLFADRRGDLRVVITMRAASLRNFSGTLLVNMSDGEADTWNRSRCIPWRQGGFAK
ncbi:hypothetical protein F5Y19DRAFT_369689 [Xylariaceae sp. FL1651]|nr:hypothetical protein F5Y19DRAFT_369689 [Xylariaceae sp. FL1651]